MEKVVENLEIKMKQTDQRLDCLAEQVGNIENEVFSEDCEEIEVNKLLRSVHEVKSNYQNLRKDLMEVQDLQRQLSSTLQVQLRLMQSNFNVLKEKISSSGPSAVSRTSSRSSRGSRTQ